MKEEFRLYPLSVDIIVINKYIFGFTFDKYGDNLIIKFNCNWGSYSYEIIESYIFH